jgi:hypothetical protein
MCFDLVGFLAGHYGGTSRPHVEGSLRWAEWREGVYRGYTPLLSRPTVPSRILPRDFIFEPSQSRPTIVPESSHGEGGGPEEEEEKEDWGRF